MRSRPLFALVVCFALAGCRSTKGGESKVPTRPISAWTGEEAQLFEDGIDRGAIPLGNEEPARDEGNEEKIPARAEAADGVLVVKVVGFGAEPFGEQTRFRVEVVADGPPLVGRGIEGTLPLSVEPRAPSYGTIRASDARLIGRKLVLFYKRYAADDGGEPITHFHLAPVTVPILEAIQLYKTRKQFD